MKIKFLLAFFLSLMWHFVVKLMQNKRFMNTKSWKSPATDRLPWKPEQRLAVFYSCESLPSYKSFSNNYVLGAGHCRRCSTNNLNKLKRKILLVPWVDEEASAPWQSQAPLFCSMQRIWPTLWSDDAPLTLTRHSLSVAFYCELIKLLFFSVLYKH